jgi:hypothetical protein
MTVRRIFQKKFKGIILKSGHVYSFRYRAWSNDPNPLIILMYTLEGTNPSTGHQWRFIQGCNMTYLPRSMRRAFANEWVRVFERTNGNVRFTYEIMKRKYPYMSHAIRRYFTKPNYYIQNIKEIPFEDMEKALISTWSKDFSKKIKISLAQKFRTAKDRRKEIKKKAKANAIKYGFKI